MRTIQCPRCLAYAQGDYPNVAALPNHLAGFPDEEMEIAESRNDPNLCPASETLVETQPSEKECHHKWETTISYGATVGYYAMCRKCGELATFTPREEP